MAVSILYSPKHPSQSPTRAARTSVGLWEGVPKVVDAVPFEFYAPAVTSQLGDFRAEICTRRLGKAF